jgi:hypothetical protein
MSIVMGKVKQRNWLLIITVFLLLASVLVLFVTTRSKMGVGVCIYDNVEYQQGQLVPNYEGRNDCYCTWSGEIVCEQEDLTMSYENFISENLQFTYSFRNFLEKESPNLSRVVLSDVNHSENTVEVILEREVLCGEEGLAPVQTAMYKQEEDALTLTTVTNRDEQLYGRVCLIGNTFVINGIDLSEKTEYSLYYQNDSGQTFKLKSCFVSGKLYGQGDVFKDTENNLLCTCEASEIECEEL